MLEPRKRFRVPAKDRVVDPAVGLAPTDRWEFSFGSVFVAYRVGNPSRDEIATLWGAGVPRVDFPGVLSYRNGSFDVGSERVTLHKAHFGITRRQRRVVVSAPSAQWYAVAAGIVSVELRRSADDRVIYCRRTIGEHLVEEEVSPLEAVIVIVTTLTQVLDGASNMRFFQFF